MDSIPIHGWIQSVSNSGIGSNSIHVQTEVFTNKLVNDIGREILYKYLFDKQQ